MPASSVPPSPDARGAHLQARILVTLEDKSLRLVQIATLRTQAANTGGGPRSGTDLAEPGPR
ncbi:hypothetical protein [Novosphingobium sp. 9U]|uniref:hypothetical protein n=1 Tax=Novosphingobium sp. 9U TaxID=2653158 RepID=UPI0012F2C253|nr:hypothetical protein [Novosphingobium sp. 9U]VWX55199.1 hypothetical protein NOVOSPHI9U_80008 [Novosphingobium sp. 9U]